MDKETFSMSLKENSRLLIVASVDRGERPVKEAARLLNISTRQVRRLLKALRAEGAQGLAHGNRGRGPVNALSNELKSQMSNGLPGSLFVTGMDCSAVTFAPSAVWDYRSLVAWTAW
jgi:transposase